MARPSLPVRGGLSAIIPESLWRRAFSCGEGFRAGFWGGMGPPSQPPSPATARQELRRGSLRWCEDWRRREKLLSSVKVGRQDGKAAKKDNALPSPAQWNMGWFSFHWGPHGGGIFHSQTLMFNCVEVTIHSPVSKYEAPCFLCKTVIGERQREKG